MNSKSIIIYFTFYVFSGLFTSEAQHSNQILFNDPENIQKISKGGGGYYAVNPTYEGVEGSPYLFSWAFARIVSNKQPSARNIPVIYDVSKDVFLMRNRGQVWEINEQMVDTILVENKIFLPLEGKYYELLNSSSILLLRKYQAELLKSSYIPALNTGSKLNSWKISSSYFVYYKSRIEKVSLRKSSLQKTLNLKKDFIKEMGEKGLKFTNERDVVKILGHLI